MIYSAQFDSAMTAATTLFNQIHADEASASKDSKKAMLRSMFARHHRIIAKQHRSEKQQGKANKCEARARRLEAKVADYANDLIY